MINALWYFCLSSLRNLIGTYHSGNNNPGPHIVCTSQWGAFAKICLACEWLKGIIYTNSVIFLYPVQVMDIWKITCTCTSPLPSSLWVSRNLLFPLAFRKQSKIETIPSDLYYLIYIYLITDVVRAV